MTGRALAIVLTLVVVALAVWLASDVENASMVDEEALIAPDVADADESDPAGDRGQDGASGSTAAPAAMNRSEVRKPEPALAPFDVTVVDDATGAPIAGANVALARQARAADYGLQLDWVGDPVVTDAGGRASFANRARASYVVARCGNYRARHVQITGSAATLRLLQASAMYGHVLDAVTFAPIVGAHVTEFVHDQPKVLHVATISGASGEYRLEGLNPRASLDVHVRIEGRVPLDEQLSLETDGSHEHDFMIDSGATLRGRALDVTNGAPIEGAELVEGDDVVARTDADGRFVLRGPSDWLPQIDVRKAGWAGSSLVAKDDPFDFTRDVVMPLVTECTLEGTVLTAEGNPMWDPLESTCRHASLSIL